MTGLVTITLLLLSPLAPLSFSSPLPLKAEPLEAEQWGLRNSGASLISPVDDITSVTLPGKEGEDIGFRRAPKETPRENASRVIVAILDTGIDATHPELSKNLLWKEEECRALESYRECLRTSEKSACDRKWAAFDSDGNGYPMDCLGWNLTVGQNPLNGIHGNSQTGDTVGHGTHVAGVIGASANGVGIRGVAQNVAILPVKIYNANPRSPVRPQSEIPMPSEKGRSWDTGFADIVARGMLYAIRSGAQIINISLAWPHSADSELMREMVKLAHERNILVVAAAGNDSTEAEVLPCAYEGVICVASHQPDGSLSHFSNHGASVDLAAPGVRILSTWPMNLNAALFTDLVGYEFKNGTSMAAPFVTGALARLLGAGASPKEAFARVLAGARLSTPPRSERSVRFGNLDLAASFQAKPQPLITSADKKTLELSWNRKTSRLPLSLALKNIWHEGQNVKLDVSLPESLIGLLELERSEVEIKSWRPQETKTIELPLRILDDRYPGEFDLWIKVNAPRPRSFKVRVAVSVPVLPSSPNNPDSNDPEMEEIPLIPLDGARFFSNEEVTVRSVTPTGTSDPSLIMRDYALVAKNSIHVLSRTYSADGSESGPYRKQGEFSLSPDNGNLLAIYRIDWDRSGTDGYALLTTKSAGPGRPVSQFQFFFLSHDLKPRESWGYAPTKAMMPEAFSWLSTGGRMVPAWVGGGFTPDSEIPSYDPWNPDWKDTPRSRFYYVDQHGLHSVKEPDSTIFVSQLTQTPSQKRMGVIPVLLARGDSYRMEYATAVVSTPPGSSKPVVSEVVPLSLPNYRMLLGFDATLPVFTLTRGPDEDAAVISETAFSLSGRPGTLRTTLLPSGQDYLSTPYHASDSVVRVAAVFSGPGGGLFTQTQYDLQFQDDATGSVAITSMRRFSFLPQLSFLRGFLGAIVHPRKADTAARPAILMEGAAGDPGSRDIIEAVLPEYDSKGQLTGLIQPARLRLSSSKECKRVLTPIAPTPTSPTQISFFCEDRFIRVPLTY